MTSKELSALVAILNRCWPLMTQAERLWVGSLIGRLELLVDEEKEQEDDGDIRE